MTRSCNRPLTVDHILQWADQNYARKGRRPVYISGKIPGTTFSWTSVEGALRHGRYGLPSDSSLARLFGKHRPHWADNRFRPRRKKIATAK